MPHRLRDIPARLGPFTLAFALSAAIPAFANNGLNLIGFGAQSVGMGGADLAVETGASALNINPAAVPREGQAFENSAGPAVGIDNYHTDANGKKVSIESPFALVGSAGYTRALGRVTLGIGLFAQGGSGTAFNNIATPFGTVDDIGAQIGVMRITPGVAWHASERLSLGVSVPLNIALAKQDVYPDTSTATFSGYAIRDAFSFSPSIKAGALFRVNDRVSIGATYSSKTKLEFRNAEMEVNYTAQGFGYVTYDETKLEGISLPQQLGIGIALRPTPQLTLALDVDWLDWSSAVERSTLTAKNPNSSLAPQTIQASSDLNWKDQVVFAIGAAYDVSDRLTLRAGYNYGRSPLPESTLSPLLAPIGEHTLTLGMGYRMQGGWKLDGALEWQVAEEVTYTNPISLTGNPSSLQIGYIAIHLTAAKVW